jgi:hypothetical protein
MVGDVVRLYELRSLLMLDPGSLLLLTRVLSGAPPLGGGGALGSLGRLYATWSVCGLQRTVHADCIVNAEDVGFLQQILIMFCVCGPDCELQHTLSADRSLLILRIVAFCVWTALAVL